MRSVPASELQPPTILPVSSTDGAESVPLIDSEPAKETVLTAPANASRGFSQVRPALQAGDKVRHPGFGAGTILTVAKSRCRVLFDNGLPPCEVSLSDLDYVG